MCKPESQDSYFLLSLCFLASLFFLGLSIYIRDSHYCEIHITHNFLSMVKFQNAIIFIDFLGQIYQNFVILFNSKKLMTHWTELCFFSEFKPVSGSVHIFFSNWFGLLFCSQSQNTGWFGSNSVRVNFGLYNWFRTRLNFK